MMIGSNPCEGCSCSCESDLSFLDKSRRKTPRPWVFFFVSLGMEPTRSRMPRASILVASVSDGTDASSAADAARTLR